MHRTASFLLLILAWPVAGVVAQRTIPLDLQRMVQLSGVIVHGRVVATETGVDRRTGAPATWTTVEVVEDLYGAAGSTVRFKQYGGTADGYVFRLAEMPRFETGSEVVLLLSPPSSQTGFQSPVGMGQGVFRVASRTGGKRVTPMTRTPNLMKSSGRPMPSADGSGTYDLEQFKSAVRAIVREVKP
jgi:hypothetical protein